MSKRSKITSELDPVTPDAPGKTHRVRTTLIAVGSVVTVLIIIGALASSGANKAAKTAAPAATRTSAPATTTVTDVNGYACPKFGRNGLCPADPFAPNNSVHTAAPTTAPITEYPSTPAVSAISTWCAGSGYSDFQAVQNDMTQLDTDSGNSNLIAVEQDGSQLFSDAHTAGLDLPPKSDPHALGYGLYMGYLLIAGYRASTGNISGAGSASSALQTASTYLPAAEAINTECGG